MKALLPLFALPLTSCVPDKTIFVLTLGDIVGITIFALILLGVAGCLFWIWLEQNYKDWKRRNKNVKK